MAKIQYVYPIAHMHGKVTKQLQCRVLNGQDIIQSNPDRSGHVNTPNEARNKQLMATASRRASEMKRRNAPEYVAAMAEYDRLLAVGSTEYGRWGYWVKSVKNMLHGQSGEGASSPIGDPRWSR